MLNMVHVEPAEKNDIINLERDAKFIVLDFNQKICKVNVYASWFLFISHGFQ